MEVDALCFSEIAGHASTALGNLATTALQTGENANSVSLLNAAFLYFDEKEVPAEDQIIFVSPKYMNALRNNTKELNRVLLQGDFGKNVSYTLTEYEGRPMAVVPPARFRTGIEMRKRGYGWKADSKEINFLVVAKSAVTHVVKYNKVKVISGDLNLAGANFDGSTIFARIYHDVIVPKNKEYAIYAHVAAEATAPTYTIDIEKDEANKVTSIRVLGEGALGVKYRFYTAEQAYEVGAVLPVGATEVKKGSVLGGETVYAVEIIGGKIVAKTN